MKETKTINANWDGYQRGLAYSHLIEFGVIFVEDFGEGLEPYGTVKDMYDHWEYEAMASIERETWGGNIVLGTYK